MDPRYADEFFNLTLEQAELLRRLTGANVHTDPSERVREQARIREIEVRRYQLSRQWTSGSFDVVA